MTALPSAAERTRPQLQVELGWVRELLESHLGGDPAPSPPSRRGTTPLRHLARRLGLSGFEHDLLLLAAAAQLDGEVAALVGRAQDGGQGGEQRPTFALAMTLLPDPHWDAVLPDRPLRRWRLVTLAPGPVLVTRPLDLDEQVLHVVTGLGAGTRLGGLVEPDVPVGVLATSQSEVAAEVARAVAALGDRVLVRLSGTDAEARLSVAARMAEHLGRTVLVVRDAAVPESDLVRVATLLERHALLDDRVVVTSDDRLVALLDAPVVVALGETGETHGRTVVARSVDLPAPEEQAALWTTALGGDGGAARDLAQHYRLSARTVGTIAAEWQAQPGSGGEELRRLTRERARVPLGVLGERVEPRARWDDLVLPDGQRALLRDLVRQVRHRARVHDEWGFGSRSARGLGISALLAGESGTGKTMAAEVVAGELGLDLHRVDLSAVVSKYVGETEKHLRAVFDAAEAGGSVLLFDEADALFGRRSDVKDAHDRYANLEVAYLLQRMEAYRGLAVLTTNLRSHLDRAFVRRLRFVVQLPFPDEAARAEIWRRVFPAATPLEGVDAEALARLQVSGGSIRSIALAAAFAAAEDGTGVRPHHLRHAAQVEYAKAERVLTATESAALDGAAR